MALYTVNMTRTLAVQHQVEAASEDQARLLAQEWAYGEYDWTEDISLCDVDVGQVLEVV